MRVACRYNISASGMEQSYDIALNSFEEQLQTGKNTAARTGSMSWSQAFRLFNQRAHRRNFYTEFSGELVFISFDQTRFEILEF
ncbi:hypothetical protein D3C71_1802020 [compost metagenome]